MNDLEQRLSAIDTGHPLVAFPVALTDRMTDLVADLEVDLDTPLS